MLDIIIEKIEQLEGVVQITAAVIKPMYLRPDEGKEDKTILELHYQRATEYLQLHLGNAIISQKRVD